MSSGALWVIIQILLIPVGIVVIAVVLSLLRRAIDWVMRSLLKLTIFKKPKA